MNKKNPGTIYLSNLQMAMLEPEYGHSVCTDADPEFGDRNDFLVTSHHSFIAVRMALLNDRIAAGEPDTEVKTELTVSLTDLTARKRLQSTTVPVWMKPGQEGHDFFCAIPFDYFTIDTGHSFRIEVREKSRRRLIGKKAVRFFHHYNCGYAPGELYRIRRASLYNPDLDVNYRSITADTTGRFVWRFVMKCATESVGPADLPELEIVAHYDGDLTATFLRIPESDGDLRIVEVPAMLGESHRGVTYVEIRCLGKAFGGQIVETGGADIVGSWSGADVLPADPSDVYAYTNRFLASLTHPDPEAECQAEDSDNEFDRLLDEFIASEKAAAEEESPAPEAEVEPQPDMAGMLSGLTGLQRVKSRLMVYEKVVKFNRLRSDNGLTVAPMPLHAMFLGSPGTGKTTVAKMMGKMLAAAGMLSRGHVVVRERATLLGQYYNSEASNTLKALEEAQGGILFIDEAYQLFQPDDPRDPGKFVIESLLTALSDESRRDWMLILAGYPDEMEKMFEMNPGLKSRIPASNLYFFDDFSEGELMEIAVKYLADSGYELTPDASCALRLRLAADHARRDRAFGNARHVINLIQNEIIPAMAVRVMETGEANPSLLRLVEAADIPAHVAPERTPRRIGFCR